MMRRSLSSLLLASSLLLLYFFFYFSSSSSRPKESAPPNPNPGSQWGRSPRLKVFVADLPRSLNYGLLDLYWSLSGHDARIGVDPDSDLRRSSPSGGEYPPYPRHPLIMQYSAEYWLLGDLETPERERAAASAAVRVRNADLADVVFVPFFATLSAEIQLGWGRKGAFTKKEGNEDYARQREVVDRIRDTDAWRRCGGRDHVFVLTDPIAMWHVRAEIAPAILLVVDFGGWYKLDSKGSGSNSSDMMTIQHTQVSLLKDVIVPYTHLLPRLHLWENKPRHTLLYFKGAKHRHRGGLVREQLWDILVGEPGVVLEEGFPNATGREQAIRGMRSSEFCLHPAGDTPTSCRLFDAVFSLCIPVVISDHIELPFEGTIDYSGFALFAPTAKALQLGWLVAFLKSIPDKEKDRLRQNMAEARRAFEYDNGAPYAIGPVPPDGAVNHIWKKIHQKLPMINEAVMREKRKVEGVSIPQRCHCS